MKRVLKIQGYKCFKDIKIDLNDLTVLIGANGVGKSSVIQSLLLMQYAAQNANDGKARLPIHNICGVDLGKTENLFNINDDNLREIRISLDETSVEIPIDNEDEHFAEADIVSKNHFNTIHYLDAERVGPRYITYYSGDDNESCGLHGENTAYIWFKHQYDDLNNINKRLFPNVEGKLGRQLDDWINYIFPDVKLKVEKLYDRALQIQVAQNSNNYSTLHIGFGISYALPILLECLILKEGETLIVENPEAHLQPKAQTRMGYFLAQMAASGIRIVVETHSEHILEGMSIAVEADNINISGDNISVVMFDMEHRPTQRNMDKDWISKSNYPIDFFEIKKEDVLLSQTSRLMALIK